MDVDTQAAAEQSGEAAWVSGQPASLSLAGDEAAVPQATGAVLKQPKQRAKVGLQLRSTTTQFKRTVLDKRGNRTKAQRRRKASALQKALAVVDRKATKNGKKAEGANRRKSAKSLWSSGSPNMFETLASVEA